VLKTSGFRVLGVALFAALSVGAVQADPGLTFEQRVLNMHNKERAKAGAEPLVWDERLARSAIGWAHHLVRTDTFDHAPQKREGENLWMGSAGAYSTDEMVGDWIEEVRHFKPGRFPDVSKTSKWSDVGHYTQLIWKATRKVGCAKANGNGMDYLVCRYDPPGNWIGTQMTNVAAN
jgi:uncharacterized protein YkwD